MKQSNDRKSILIVEDEAVTLEHLFLVLSHKFPDFNIYKAADGKIGTEVFARYNPEIVVTDLTMPVMNGLEMATAIHAIDPSTKFVIVTGDIGKNVADVVTAKGMTCHHINKPVFFQELFDAIQKCIDGI